MRHEVDRMTPVARLIVVFAASVLIGSAAPARAQQPPPPDPSAPDQMPPREVQRLFEAYVLMQAQERLGIADAQYPQFVQRLKALQDVRRRIQASRAVLLQELARGTSGQPGLALDDAGLRDRLARLREVEEQGARDLWQAHEALDQILDLRQQARFRVFEEQMERRKVELLSRARRAARARGLGQSPGQ
jgi:hypothetical protein